MSALESYFITFAVLDHGCFPMDFQENFRNPFLQNNCELLYFTLELKKEGANIGHQLSC